jgi:competence protein ComEC
MPDGQVWLYDAGRLGDHERSYQPIVNALWHLGHSRLDRILLSHADSDHYNAFPGVLERFRPRSMTTTDAVLRHPSPSIHLWLDNVKRRGVRLETWRRGDGYLGSAEWRVDVLHPSGDVLHRDKEAKPRRNVSDNAQSLCLAIHYAGRSIVLPGDLEPPGTDALTSLPRIDADALMAPHHGSLSADADRVVRWARPHTVVISGGTRAVNERVEAMFTPPGGRLLITARDHALRMEIAQDGQVTWRRWRDDRWQPLGESSHQTAGVVSP